MMTVKKIKNNTKMIRIIITGHPGIKTRLVTMMKLVQLMMRRSLICLSKSIPIKYKVSEL